jgi:hypothetical protein
MELHRSGAGGDRNRGRRGLRGGVGRPRCRVFQRLRGKLDQRGERAPICDTSCGETQPSEGERFAWFGSWFEPETASLSRDVTTPSGSELVLAFDLDAAFCDSPDDYFDIYLDGNPVITTDPCTVTGGYVPRQVDVSSYADGGTRTLLLKGETFLTNGDSGSFLVDQVDLTVPARPSECTPTGGCTLMVNLENETITGSDTRTACQTLTAGNGFVVDARGDLRLVAGETVVLGDGFSVLTGGALTVEIDPSLLP